MKKQLFLLMAVVVAGISSLQAQGGGGNMPRRTVEERVKAVNEKIVDFKLDKDKAVQSDSIFTTYYKAQDKMREEMMAGGGQPDREKMREVFEKLGTDRDEKLKKVFSEEQFKKWKDEIEPSMRQRRQGGGN